MANPVQVTGSDADKDLGLPECLTLFAPDTREQLSRLEYNYLRSVAAVARFIRRRYVYRRHQIGSGIFDESGRGFFGLHLEALVGRASVCAEAVALGNAIMNDCSCYRLIVTLRHPLIEDGEEHMRIVPPCGLCRELLADYCADMLALVPVQDDSAMSIVSIRELIPNKYVGSKWLAFQPQTRVGQKAGLREGC